MHARTERRRQRQIGEFGVGVVDLQALDGDRETLGAFPGRGGSLDFSRLRSFGFGGPGLGGLGFCRRLRLVAQDALQVDGLVLENDDLAERLGRHQFVHVQPVGRQAHFQVAGGQLFPAQEGLGGVLLDDGQVADGKAAAVVEFHALSAAGEIQPAAGVGRTGLQVQARNLADVGREGLQRKAGQLQIEPAARLARHEAATGA